MCKSIFCYSLCVLLVMTSSKLWASSSYTLPDGEVLQDPTKPELWSAPAKSGGKKNSMPSFKLNYIVSSGGVQRAMINNQKVVVGDVISGATVQRINSDSVDLVYQSKQKTLRMNKVKGIMRN